MDFILVPNRYTLYLKYNLGETHMKGSLASNLPGVTEYNPIRKREIDQAIRELDYGDINYTLQKEAFPEYKGDFYKDKYGDYYIKPLSPTEREGSYYEINEKGLITRVEKKIPSGLWETFDYSYVDRKTLPTVITDLNLTDVIRLDKEDKTKGVLEYKGNLKLKERPTILGDVAALYASDIGFNIGDFVMANEGSNLALQKFIKSTGVYLDKKDHPEAYKIFGDTYSLDYGAYGNGRPWRNLSKISQSMNLEISKVEEKAMFDGKTFGGYAIFVTKNMVYMYGGSDTYSSNTCSDEVKRMLITASGNIEKPTVVGRALEERKFARAVCANGYVYIVGGWNAAMQTQGTSKVMRAKIKPDGTLNAWEYTGNPMLNGFCSSDVYIVKRKLYVRGGWNFEPGKVGTRNMRAISCLINEDGSLGPWVEERSITSVGRDNKSYVHNNLHVDVLTPVSGSQSTTHFTRRTLGRYNRIGSPELMYSFSPDPVNSCDVFTSKGGFVSVADLFEGGTQVGNHGGFLSGSVYSTGYPNNSTKQAKYSTHRLSFFDGFAIKDKIIIPGGFKSAMEQEEVATDQVWRILTVVGLGENDYMPYIDGSKNLAHVPEGKFAVPDIEPEIFNGLVYDFYVKVL